MEGRASPRLERLPRARVLGRDVPMAIGARARLLGLAYMDRKEAGTGLLIPSCSSVHTFGMRFPLDLVFLDERGTPLAIQRNVRPRRLGACRAATAVLELPSPGATDLNRFLEGARPDSEGENLPPLSP